jgi:hypothetical protein
MVTVAFELHDTPYVFPNVTIPLFGPQYIRYPMQPGDKGIVIPADTYLGGVSGQGGGVADLTLRQPERPGIPADQQHGMGGRRRERCHHLRA